MIQVIGMEPSMDDRRIFAEIERRLTRDDPELASLLDFLNQHLVQTSKGVAPGKHNRRALQLLTVLVLALAITVVLIAMFATP